MIFSSTTFVLVFLPVLLIAYHINKSRAYRNIVLLIASILFYAWGEPVFVLIMLLFVFINWELVRLMDTKDGKKRKSICTIAILLDVLLLFIFKYLSFILFNLGMFMENITVVQIALPIGISFFTFQMMSYVWDVYYGKCRAQKNVLKVALYITLFPQLIAGPIVRYEQIEKELTDREENYNKRAEGIIRFFYGFAKKVLLSNYIGFIADQFFNASSRTLIGAWTGAICYSLQIYYDFSGYSDMAIGLGTIFGFHFPENFNRPYLARSITDFWRRWHITLSGWFRDYVYIPLGGNREGKRKWIRNLFIVWALTGIWHGANWTFLFWGLGYFVLLLFEKLLFQKFLDKHKVLAHIYTLLFVCLLWVLFRADSIVEAVNYFGNLFGTNISAICDSETVYNLMNAKVFLLCGILFVLPIKDWIDKWLGKKFNRKQLFHMVVASVLFGISVISIMKSSYNPFIYFNF